MKVKLFQRISIPHVCLPPCTRKKGLLETNTIVLGRVNSIKCGRATVSTRLLDSQTRHALVDPLWRHINRDSPRWTCPKWWGKPIRLSFGSCRGFLSFVSWSYCIVLIKGEIMVASQCGFHDDQVWVDLIGQALVLEQPYKSQQDCGARFVEWSCPIVCQHSCRVENHRLVWQTLCD